MRWQPPGTFIQTGMDAMNAMLLTPGEFASFGHDYRADMAAFVRDAYGLPEATDEQLARIEEGPPPHQRHLLRRRVRGRARPDRQRANQGLTPTVPVVARRSWCSACRLHPPVRG